MKKGFVSVIASIALALSFAPSAMAAGHYGGGGGGEEGGETTLGNNLSVPAIFVPNSTQTGAPALRVACASTPQAPQGPRAGGYWEAATDGGVFNFGSASYLGSMGGRILNKPVVGIASPKNSQGYWLVASDGGVFTFNVPYYGSTGNRTLNAPVVGMVVDPATGGYWLVASDGGVFNFNAPYLGSTGGRHLNKPVVGMAATPSGQGYTLVASDGGVFNFGDAGYYGSLGGQTINKPVVGMAATPSGKGYTLVASDGGVFNFGDAGFYGSLGGDVISSPIVGMQSTPTGQGYELASAAGSVFTFGDALFYGDMSGLTLNKPVVGMAHYPGYWLQGTEATWSASCTEAASASVTAAWGDNLLSAAKAGKQNRVEVALLDTADLGKVGYPITNLTPNLEDRYATYGTDGTSMLSDGVNMVTHVWGPGATLSITGPSESVVYNGPITAEINSSGAVVFGYNWPASPAGDYTLVFTIGSGVTITGSNGDSNTGTSTTLSVTLG